MNAETTPYDLICLGNITLDDVVLPDGQSQPACFGGDAVYAVLAARLWSPKVGFVAPIGSDFPKPLLEKLHQSGLDTRGMPTRPLTVIRNRVVYGPGGQRTWTLLTDPDNFYPLSPQPKDIPLDYLNAHAFLILAMDMQAQAELAPFLKATGALVALDPQEDYIPGHESRLMKILQDVDIFMPSREEVRLLLHHDDLPRAARQLAAAGPKMIIVKLGESGSLVHFAGQDEDIHLPIHPTHTRDTTGAGDSYCGGFMTTYAQTGDAVRAGLAGAVSASYAVEGFGLNHMFDIDPKAAQLRLEHLANSFNQTNT